MTVTNARPVVSPFLVDKNSQRRLQISAVFADKGRLDTHTARVQWGDGTESSGVVVERNGLGLPSPATNTPARALTRSRSRFATTTAERAPSNGKRRP